MVRFLGGQRESEGVVVPLIGAKDTSGGKDACFDHVREAGRREGTTEASRSNHPERSSLVVAVEEPLVASPVKVRQLQGVLWAAAKQPSGREDLDFPGCHLRARMSGRLWEQQRVIRYYLHRWPSQQTLKRLRDKVRDRTGRNRVGQDIR